MDTSKLRISLVATVAVALVAMLTSSCTAPGTPGRTASASVPWDISGILGTGQSLSVGAEGHPVISTVQPYGNLKLSTGHLPWPVDPEDPSLSLVPLVEPIGRVAPAYPSSWPENIDGETYHSAMGNEITALALAGLGRNLVTVHSAVGESGQGMIYLRKNPEKKGLNGRSYEAALVETRAIARLARASSRTYGIGAIVLTHGESDAGNADYEKQVRQLGQDYNTDLPAITGQSQRILMIVSQQNSCNDHSPSTLAQWRIGVDYPADFVCSGPKYQYPSFEGVHLTSEGYRQLGEKYAQVYFKRVVMGEEWRPLEPMGAVRAGRVVTVRFHVPVPPLVWDAALAAPHPSAPEWRDAKGFEVSSAAGGRVAIESAVISGDSVVLTCASDPGPNARVGYAMVGEKKRMAAPFEGTFRWGLLRDSDPFVGSVTRKAQPNYCVAFDLTAP